MPLISKIWHDVRVSTYLYQYTSEVNAYQWYHFRCCWQDVRHDQHKHCQSQHVGYNQGDSLPSLRRQEKWEQRQDCKINETFHSEGYEPSETKRRKKNTLENNYSMELLGGNWENAREKGLSQRGVSFPLADYQVRLGPQGRRKSALSETVVGVTQELKWAWRGPQRTGGYGEWMMMAYSPNNVWIT